MAKFKIWPFLILAFLPAMALASSELNFPRLSFEPGVFTGIAIANPTNQNATVTFTAYGSDGELLAGPGFQNPVERVIPANQQIAINVAAEDITSELFGAALGLEAVGWFQATSSVDGLTGFFLFLDSPTTFFDGADLPPASQKIIFNDIRVDEGFSTELNIINPGNAPANLQLQLYGSTSTPLAASELTLNSKGVARLDVFDQFGVSGLSAGASVVVTSLSAGSPVAGFEFVRSPADLLGLTARPSSEVLQTLFIPQLAAQGGIRTFIGLTNYSSQEVSLVISAHQPDGSLYDEPVGRSLPPNASLREDLQSLFNFPGDDLVDGWVRVEATALALNGNVSYITDGGSLAAVSSLAQPQTRAIFSQLATDLGFFTGLAVLNAGTFPVNLRVAALQPNGQLLGRFTTVLAPGQRLSKLVDELIPEAAGRAGGVVWVRSDLPVFMSGLFGLSNVLVNVPPQPVLDTFEPDADLANLLVSPVLAFVSTNGTQEFTALGSGSSPVTWAINQMPDSAPELGAIDMSGVYSAPPLLPPQLPLVITASTDTAVGGASLDVLNPEVVSEGLGLIQSVAFLQGLQRIYTAELAGFGGLSAQVALPTLAAAPSTEVYENNLGVSRTLIQDFPGQTISKILPFLAKDNIEYLILANQTSGELFRLNPQIPFSAVVVRSGLVSPTSMAFDVDGGILVFGSDDPVKVTLAELEAGLTAASTSSPSARDPFRQRDAQRRQSETLELIDFSHELEARAARLEADPDGLVQLSGGAPDPSITLFQSAATAVAGATVDACTGDVYFSDRILGAIRRFDRSSGEVETVVEGLDDPGQMLGFQRRQVGCPFSFHLLALEQGRDQVLLVNPTRSLVAPWISAPGANDIVFLSGATTLGQRGTVILSRVSDNTRGNFSPLGPAGPGSLTSVDVADLYEDRPLNASDICPGTIEFADFNLAEAVRAALGLEKGADIPCSSVTELTSLVARSSGIARLQGIGFFQALQVLLLGDNLISEIGPLARLSGLTGLELRHNQISDITPLSGLTALDTLDLADNLISDINALSGLSAIRRLNVGMNDIDDIAPLAGLVRLTVLDLAINDISDISILSRFTELEQLGLGANNISDLSALVQNPGLGQGDEVDIRLNPLDEQDCPDIGTLLDRGVALLHDVPCGFTLPLTIRRAGLQTGAVTVIPFGFVCDGPPSQDCVFTVPASAEIRVVANAPVPGGPPGFISGTVGSAQVCTPVSTCKFLIAAASQVTVTFDPQQQESVPTLALSVQGDGGVLADSQGCATQQEACTTSYIAGSEVTLEAVPKPGYAFEGFSGDCVSSSTSCTFIIASDSSVTAEFSNGTRLLKTGVLDVAATAPVGSANPGDVIHYSFKVSNASSDTIHNILLTDPTAGTIICPSGNPIPSLAPGAMETCTALYTLSQADIDAGHKDNVASADSDETAAVTDTETVAISPAAALRLIKSGILDSAVTGAPGVADPGDRINYSFRLTNTGNLTLTNLSLTDPMAAPISCPSQTLAAGAMQICSGSYTITQADIEAGRKDNTASADSDQTAAVTDSETVIIPAAAGLTLVKSGRLDVTATAPEGLANPGDRIDYVLKVTNTGNLTLTNVRLTDPELAAINCPTNGANTIASLAVGAMETCNGSYTITQADIDAGRKDNTASADSDQTAAVTDAETVLIPTAAALTLVKSGILDIAATAPMDSANPGDRIDYTFQVSNTGNLTLSNVSVTDPEVSSVICPAAGVNPILSLAVGAMETCIGTYIITQADINAGQKINTASADSDQTSAVMDTETVAISATSALLLVKTGSLDTSVAGDSTEANPGDRIDYNFALSNNGNVTLTNLSLTDPDVPAISCPSSGNNTIASLAVGAMQTCSGAYTLTQADIDAGQKVNTASADSDETGAVTDTETVAIPALPGLQLVKTGLLDTSVIGDSTVADPGDQIDYEFALSNTGNVTLNNLSLTDPDVPTISCPASGNNTIPSLAVGAMQTCTGTYTLSQADIDAGQKDNTASADSDETGAVMDSETVAIPALPALLLVKTGVLDTSATGDPAVADPGDQIDYEFALTNTGNVTLNNLSLTDPDVPIIACPASGNNTISSLAVGAMQTCTGTYTLSQADIDAGQKVNTASADSDETGAVMDTETVAIPAAAALLLVKTGRLDTGFEDQADPGDRIDYDFALTNSGNVTLTNLSLADPDLPAISCPSSGSNTIASLAVGAMQTCSGSYTLTQADIDAGQKVNTASADSDQTGAVMDTETVTIPVVPGLLLVKTGVLDTSVSGDSTVADPGDRINYGFALTNSGNVTLNNLSLTDPDLPSISCPSSGSNTIASLAVGAMQACSGSYTLTQADIDAGQKVNTASADSDETGAVMDTETVAIPALPAMTLVKAGALNTAVTGDPDLADPGDQIDYDFTVSNTGNVTLADIILTDPDVAVITCPGGDNTIAALAVGAMQTCVGSYSIVQADIDAGQKDNTASASSDQASTVMDSETVIIPALPALTLQKAGLLVLAASGDPLRFKPSNQIDYTFTVTNTGNVTLINIILTDPELAALTCPGSGDNTIASLAVGMMETCSGSYTVVQADIDAQQKVNTATVVSDQTNAVMDTVTVSILLPKG